VSGALGGTSVLVAGAGLAGLAAARDLMRNGADVLIIDAQARVGGRVWTRRDGFVERQHAEAGGDLIDEAQSEIRQLAAELGLRLSTILRGGFAYARQDRSGRVRLVARSGARGWEALTRALAPAIRPYNLAEQRWDSPIAAAIARQSVAHWLDGRGADDELRTVATALRGFFLADPDELSLLALVDQFASAGQPGSGDTYRVEGGNDRLATAMASELGSRLKLNTELVALSQRGREVRASLKQGRTTSQLARDYVVLALPATLLKRIPVTPALPAPQHDAIARLCYGRVTKTLLQFSRRFWRGVGRPRAFGSSLPIGAVWDGNEQQRGRAGILSLMAGGGASSQTQALVAKQGTSGLTDSLEWLGAKRAQLLKVDQTTWEDDPWARGGYAFFDPAYDPGLRGWLARPFGRLFFAGEHTSVRWQGYMNGAIESGRRAAAEIEAMHLGNLRLKADR
jgi:monoamine oxidase